METFAEERHALSIKFREKFAFLFDKHSLFYHVLLLILVGLGFFAYALLTEKFTTPFSGDYSMQYIAFEYNFYDDWWTFFKTGQFPFYDSNTFLGADNVISNTYYGLFSPYTFPILFFPRSFVPHAMALVTIAKLVVGALLFRLYLKYMGVSESSARIFSIAYAFMGWNAYYLWFNNFAEVLSFFPLVLFGIEKIIRQKQIWACSLGFFLMGLGNYFFLLTFGIFGVVYALFRFCQTVKERGGWKNYKEHAIVLGLGIAGFAIGYLLSAAVVFPAVFGSFGISRASTSSKYFALLKQAIDGKDLKQLFRIVFTYWHPNVISGAEPSNYFFEFTFPLASYFYPTLSDRYVNIVGYSSFENAGSSIFFFTPCIIMFGGCLYRSYMNKKVSHFIAIGLCVLCLFVPFFYFLSGAFTNNYGRWEIIVPTLGLMYIALNFDHRNEIPRPVIIISAIVAMVGMIMTYVLALKMIELYGYEEGVRTSNYIMSLYDDDQIAVVWYEIILCSLETILICGYWKKVYLAKIIKVFIIGEAIIMGNVVANMHYLQSIETDVNSGLEPLSHQVALIDRVNKEDPTFFRMYSSVADDAHVNIPQADNYNGLTTFHTFYNNQVDDFVHMMDMMTWDESWSAHYLYKHQYLESFLGVKYYLTRDSDTKYYNPDHVYEPNVPLNYSLYIKDEENGYRIYKNDHHINFGIAYDTLYYKHRDAETPKYNAFYNPSESSVRAYLRNEEVLFKGAILNDEDLVEVASAYPDKFNVIDGVPKLQMATQTMRREGIYAPYNINSEGEKEYYYLDPENPTHAIKDEFLVTDTKDKSIPVNTYQIVYKPFVGKVFPHSAKGSYFVIDYPIRTPWNNYNACVWLIDEQGKTITFDEVRNTLSDGRFVGRALYSAVPVSKIIICPMSDEFYDRQSLTYYYEGYTTIEKRLDNAADNGIYDFTRNGNRFTFKTSYDSEKFFVSQLAYTEGWKVKTTSATGEVSYPKVYNAQGGFAGFVAPRGETTYEITYMTPGLTKWALVSAAAFLGLGASIAIPIIVKRKREVKSSLETSSN